MLIYPIMKQFAGCVKLVYSASFCDQEIMTFLLKNMNLEDRKNMKKLGSYISIVQVH